MYYVCICMCMIAQANYSMLFQNTYHFSDLITGFPGHSNGSGNSEVSIRELVPLPIFILLTTEIEPRMSSKTPKFRVLAATSTSALMNPPPEGIVQRQPLEGTAVAQCVRFAVSRQLESLPGSNFCQQFSERKQVAVDGGR